MTQSSSLGSLPADLQSRAWSLNLKVSSGAMKVVPLREIVRLENQKMQVN